MLTTKLDPPHGGDEDYLARSWAQAISRGHWGRVDGHDVLMLGNADYALVGGKLYSVNGGGNPFTLRWHVDRFANGHLDDLAREQFTLRYGAPLVQEATR